MKKNRDNTKKKDHDLQKAFGITDRVSYRGVFICFLSLISMLISLAFWKNDKGELFRWIGLSSFFMAFVGVIMGFVSQSANLYVQHIARKSGKGPDFFKEYQRPSLFRQIVKHFPPAQCTTAPRFHTNVRSNARAYRSAPRPAFAHASNSSRGSRRSPNGNGGDSDGDPPEPPPHAVHRVRRPHSVSKAVPLPYFTVTVAFSTYPRLLAHALMQATEMYLI